MRNSSCEEDEDCDKDDRSSLASSSSTMVNEPSCILSLSYCFVFVFYFLMCAVITQSLHLSGIMNDYLLVEG